MLYTVQKALSEMSLLQYLLGDDIVDSETPCLKQLIDAYDEYKTSVLGVQKVAIEDARQVWNT